MSGLIDTYYNLSVFVFVGFLVWLYVKPCALDDTTAEQGLNQRRD